MFDWLRKLGRYISGDDFNYTAQRRSVPTIQTRSLAPSVAPVKSAASKASSPDVAYVDSFSKRLENASTVPDCLELFLQAETGSREEEAAAGKMLKMSGSLSDWLEVIRNVHHDTAIGARAVERVQSLASGLDDWLEVYSAVAGDEGLTGLRAVAEQKLLEKAGTIANLARLHEIAEGSSDFEKRIEAGMQALAKTSDDWTSILQSSSSGSGLRKLAVQNIVASLTTPMDCAEFCDKELLEDEEVALVAERMGAMTAAFDDWNAIVEGNGVDSVRESLQSLAFAKMIEAVNPGTSRDDLIHLLDKAHDSFGEEEHDRVIGKIRTLSLPFSTWSGLYDETKDKEDDEVRELAFGKMLELATSKEDLLSIRRDTDEDDSEALEKSLEAIGKLQLTNEEWEAVLEDSRDDDTELASLAFLKLLGFAEKADAVMGLYRDYLSWLDDYTPEEDIKDKILDRLSAVATDSERKIIAILTENDDDSSLHDRMEESVHNAREEDDVPTA